MGKVNCEGSKMDFFLCNSGLDLVSGALLHVDDRDLSFNNIAGEIPPTLPPNVEYLYVPFPFSGYHF